jgi:hypothetical protein
VCVCVCVCVYIHIVCAGSWFLLKICNVNAYKQNLRSSNVKLTVFHRVSHIPIFVRFVMYEIECKYDNVLCTWFGCIVLIFNIVIVLTLYIYMFYSLFSNLLSR